MPPAELKPALRRLPLAVAGGKDAPLVVTMVVAVRHHAARRAAHDDDDVVLELHGQYQACDVESCRRLEIGDDQNQALEASVPAPAE